MVMIIPPVIYDYDYDNICAHQAIPLLRDFYKSFLSQPPAFESQPSTVNVKELTARIRTYTMILSNWEQNTGNCRSDICWPALVSWLASNAQHQS